MKKKYPITIKINNGTLIVYSNLPNPTKGRCRGCGKEIFWVQTISGKSMPISKLDDGTFVSHFFDCSHAKSFRKKYQKQ